MAGKVQLQGAVLANALDMLGRVTDVLAKHGVRYWLESGTLLGVVREQRLLPWDTDIDLSVTSDQLPALRKCMRSLFWQGYRVRLRCTEADDGPLRKGDVRLAKVRSRRLFFFRGPLLIDIFVKYRHGEHYYWHIGSRQHVAKRVPASYYDTLDEISFEGRQYAVPSQVEHYLEARYGDWRTPKREWNIFKDDRAITGNPGRKVA